MRAVDAEVVEQSDDVARQRSRRDLTVSVRRPAVSLQLYADDPVLLRKRRDEAGKVQVDAQHPAVQQDERRSFAVRLVVHVHAIDVDVSAVGDHFILRALIHRALCAVTLLTTRPAGSHRWTSPSTELKWTRR